MNHANRRTILLVQLPIPPHGPTPVRGNVPLAAAYLKVYAETRGLGAFYDIALLPAEQANTLGDQALVAAIIRHRPWMVGFTCYLWNIERTLWLARAVKRALPGVRVVLGGPEITPDNAWVLQTADYDFAVIGEGEQTFSQLLLGLLDDDVPPVAVPGLYVPAERSRYESARLPAFRTPLPDLNVLGSPYLAGILDAADERMMLLETSRGCRYRCRFCYYWKSYDGTYYLADETIRANLRHAAEREVREVFLLDPTLNQRKDFAALLRLLAECNPEHRWTYFAELRAEGMTEETARLLREANFTEVEVGLQSIEPDAMALMDRKNNLRAFERGVRAMLAQGIRVKVDLIVGLPGDTAASVRRGLHYVHDNGLASDVQVFNLAVLPGTAFRQDADRLGLAYQPRPPYYVLETPHLGRTELFGLMQEAQDLFGIEFDAPPAPVLDFTDADHDAVWRVDLDRSNHPAPPPADRRCQAFTLWLRAERLDRHGDAIATLVRSLVRDNPFATLQVVLEPAGPTSAAAVCRQVGPRLLAEILAVCQEQPTYLDKFYAMQPGRLNGSKRLLVLLPLALRRELSIAWVEAVGEAATLVWRGVPGELPADGTLEPHEYAWSEQHRHSRAPENPATSKLSEPADALISSNPRK
jgi:radical SAM superfamily enzyme YgiQ (UPF0313 family)